MLDSELRASPEWAHLDPKPLATGAQRAYAVGGQAMPALYDPYPREGQQLSFSTEPRFWNYFQAEGGGWKGCVIASLSGTGVK